MKRNAGFTMIEAIVIVAVIAIIGGILTPMVIKEVAKSKITRARADMEAISTAFNEYFVDTSYWPEKQDGSNDTSVDLVGFPALFTNSQSLTGWDGPYIDRAVLNSGAQQIAYKDANNVYQGVVDPWGTPFKVVYGKVGGANGGPGGAVAILSLGPDRTSDTSDANALAGVATDDDLVKVVTKRMR